MQASTDPIFTNREREAWLPPVRESICDWAERTLILPRSVSARPGPLDLSLNPYVREVVEAGNDPDTEEITVCWSTQVGKTLSAMILVLHSLARDPFNMLWVAPRDPDAQGINDERFQPIIDESPELAELKTGRKRDANLEAIKLNGCVITFAGAHSPAALSSKANRIVVFDEVDKYPEWSGREADPIELAKERQRTFWNSLTIKVSTPTTDLGYIWNELERGTWETYRVPCPHCGAYQELEFGAKGKGTPGVKWPDDVRDPDVLRDSGAAWYECAACEGEIRDHHKPAMLEAGVWAPRGIDVDEAGILLGDPPSRRHRSFHLWAAYSPWITFAELAAKFLESRSRPAKLMNFTNSWLALPWSETVAELKEDRLLELEDDRPSSTVPEDAWILTAGVDVQEEAGAVVLYYAIRAWGKDEQSWSVRVGYVRRWEELYRVLFRVEYKTPSGREIVLVRPFLDSGFRTEDVYRFCKQTGCIPLKGEARPKLPIDIRDVETKTAGVMPLAHHWSDYYKDYLHRLIGEGKWRLHRQMPKAYLSHLVSEQKVLERNKRTGRTSMVWKVIRAMPNHWLDCECYALSAADYLDVSRMRAPELRKKKRKPETKVIHRMQERVFTQ